jgi:hypothetical protein
MELLMDPERQLLLSIKQHSSPQQQQLQVL